jgi:hypothetical protein
MTRAGRMVLFSIGMTIVIPIMECTIMNHSMGLDFMIGLICGTWATTLYYIFELKGSQEEITAKEVEVYKNK